MPPTPPWPPHVPHTCWPARPSCHFTPPHTHLCPPHLRPPYLVHHVYRTLAGRHIRLQHPRLTTHFIHQGGYVPYCRPAAGRGGGGEGGGVKPAAGRGESARLRREGESSKHMLSCHAQEGACRPEDLTGLIRGDMPYALLGQVQRGLPQSQLPGLIRQDMPMGIFFSPSSSKEPPPQ